MAITQVNNYSELVKTHKGKSKDAFKPLFCKPQFYTVNQNNFEKIQQFLSTHNLNPLTEVIVWTTLLCLLRRPTDWFGGVKKVKRLSKKTNMLPLQIRALCHDLQIDWPAKLNPEITFFDFLNSVQIKPLPEVAHKSLIYILTYIYPMTVLNYEPDPLELLKIQCEGRRIITFKNDYQNWPEQKFGHRDVLSFWLHDCIHAEHFFSQPDNFVSQIGFYKFVQSAIENKSWQNFLAKPGFDEAFIYLISDMNSHPLHLFKTFKAIIDIHFSEHSTTVWEKVFTPSTKSTAEKEAMRKLNTAYFTSDDCDALLQLTKRLGA